MRHKLTLYVSFLLVLILAIPAVACRGEEQELEGPMPAVQWSKTFGEGNNVSGGPIQQTKDGGYILCGMLETPRTETHKNKESAWLIKTDANGNKLWDRMFDGGYINSLQQTSDDGYIMCGTTESYGADKANIWLIKTDAEGNKIWDKTFGDNKGALGESIQQTTDGGYIVCGTKELYGDDNDDIWLIKTDAEGNKLWNKIYGGEHDNLGCSAHQTADGGYVLCGIIKYRPTDYEINTWPRLVKTDNDGNMLWDKTLGPGNQQCGPMIQSTDGGYVLCGDSMIVMATIQVLLIKTDINGDTLWEKKFGSKGIAFGFSVQQTTDGGYIICGVKYKPLGSGTSMWIIKTDADGNKLWDRLFSDEKWSSGNSIQQTADGGYIICGTTSPYIEGAHSIQLMKLAPEQ